MKLLPSNMYAPIYNLKVQKNTKTESAPTTVKIHNNPDNGMNLYNMSGIYFRGMHTPPQDNREEKLLEYFSRKGIDYLKPLLDLKTSKGKNRFDAWDIKELYDDYKKDPENVIMLAKIENSKKNPLFTPEDISNILASESFKENPDMINTYARLEDKNGEHLFKNYCGRDAFSCFVRNQDIIMTLANMTDLKGEKRFSAKDFSSLIYAMLASLNDEGIIELAKITNSKGEPRFNGSEINQYSSSFITRDPKIMEAIRTLSVLETSKGDLILKTDDIYKFFEFYRKDPKTVIGLLKLEYDGKPLIYADEDNLCCYGNIRNIFEAYKEDPEAFKAIATMTDSSGNRIFEYANIVMDNLISLYHTNPEVFKVLAKMEKPEGCINKQTTEASSRKQRFDIKDLRNLIPKYSKNPQAVKELANMTTSEGEPRLSGYAIAKLIEPYTQNPQAVKELANMTTSQGKPCLEGFEIAELIEPYTQNPQAVKELAELETSEGKPIFGSSDINDLIESYEQNPDAVINLSKIEIKKGVPRFDHWDILNLIELYNKNPQAFMAFASCKSEYGRDTTPYYDIGNIKKIIEKLDNNKEAVNTLSQIKTSKGKPVFKSIIDIEETLDYYLQDPAGTVKLAQMENADGEPRFDWSEYSPKELIKKHDKYPNAVMELANIIMDGKYRFNAEAIRDLAEIYDKNPQVVKELANMTTSKGEPRLSGYDISELIEPYTQNPQAVKELANMTTSRGEPRLSGYAISKLIEPYTQNPQAVIEVVNMKTSYGGPLFTNTDEIVAAVDAYIQHPKEFTELAALKTFGGSPRFDCNEIISLIEAYKKDPQRVIALAQKRACFPEYYSAAKILELIWE